MCLRGDHREALLHCEPRSEHRQPQDSAHFEPLLGHKEQSRCSPSSPCRRLFLSYSSFLSSASSEVSNTLHSTLCVTSTALHAGWCLLLSGTGQYVGLLTVILSADSDNMSSCKHNLTVVPKLSATNNDTMHPLGHGSSTGGPRASTGPLKGLDRPPERSEKWCKRMVLIGRRTQGLGAADQ